MNRLLSSLRVCQQNKKEIQVEEASRQLWQQLGACVWHGVQAWVNEQSSYRAILLSAFVPFSALYFVLPLLCLIRWKRKCWFACNLSKIRCILCQQLFYALERKQTEREGGGKRKPRSLASIVNWINIEQSAWWMRLLCVKKREKSAWRKFVLQLIYTLSVYPVYLAHTHIY